MGNGISLKKHNTLTQSFFHSGIAVSSHSFHVLLLKPNHVHIKRY